MFRECHCVLAKRVGFIISLYIIKSCLLNHFVFPRGQHIPVIVFVKANGTQLGMSAKDLTLLLLTIFVNTQKFCGFAKANGFIILL